MRVHVLLFLCEGMASTSLICKKNSTVSIEADVTSRKRRRRVEDRPHDAKASESDKENDGGGPVDSASPSISFTESIF